MNDIQVIKEDMRKFKELVLSGVPKIMTGEAFTSEEEQIAVSAFLMEQGMNLESPMIQSIQPQRDVEGNLILPTREEFNQTLFVSLMDSLNRIFSGKYGI